MSDVQLFVWTCDLCGDRHEDTKNIFPNGWRRYSGFMMEIKNQSPNETHYKVDACAKCVGETCSNGFMGGLFAWIKGFIRRD